MRYGSVCSGIEAASVAWESLGWQPAWFAEIEAFPSAVLAHHWPDVTNLGDMTGIAAAVHAGDVEAPDVLVGGTPCQAFSIAGLRYGLADKRGQLSLSYVELANAIDDKRRERGEEEAITVWENVPGVLSSKDNAFGCFIGALAGESCELQPAGGKWPNAGCVYGPSRIVAWRVLDAQFFGVAQRRRRVFVVASARKGFDPAEVLFEFDSMRRDTPPRREPQTAVTTDAGSGIEGGSHWDNPANPHPTLNQSNNIGGIGASNQEIFAQRGAGNHDTSHANSGQPPAICIQHASIGRHNAAGPQGKGYQEDVAFTQDSRASADVVQFGIQVRRLTPIECERLQGFPDNHTQIPWRGKAAADCPDGPRYKAIGNSMAVPVMRWIGERIQQSAEETEPSVPLSPYCQSLNELRARQAHMLKEVGDQWCTPDALWWGINARFGPFVLDLFADHHNARCEAYYTAEDNALAQNWSARLAELGGAAYANPPYSRAQQFEGQYITGMVHIMRHTMAMRELGGRYVYLIKAATSESWWPENADHIAFIRGRISFDLPDWFKPADEKQKPSGAFFAGAIAVFDKSWNGPAISYISREELEAMGEIFIHQIQRAALRIQGVAA
ncbi:phage N-6-adenine-methyltransferase [Salmonella enterica]|nr:phage N-6-adenine-methyltransferase [Salmonella enterica]EGL7936777.1 phage N-6-adenine-methyltransferase [Salmonella enterica]EHQ8090942.1 phage N-6-adenine-methyltransferase [Salmonella enterica]EHU8013918.1 phage N-6-adenine-methyltransferase [Salmonella enterica]EIB7528438.1 phage N-6-adenine-methyltransferase [Salmonella enterica]